MAFEGIRNVRESIRATFSFENIVLVLTVGFVMLQLISYLGSTWFNWDPIYFGPYLLLTIVAGVVILVFSFLRRSHEFLSFDRGEWALIIILTLILVGALIVLRKNNMFAPYLFSGATDQLMSIIGVR